MSKASKERARVRKISKEQRERHIANLTNPVMPVVTPTLEEVVAAPVPGELDLKPIKNRMNAAEAGPWEADKHAIYVFRRPGIGPVTDTGDPDEAFQISAEMVLADVKTRLHTKLAEGPEGVSQEAVAALAVFVENLKVTAPLPIVRIRGFGRGAPQQENNEFIAGARTDIPALVDEVEKLRAERDTLLQEKERLQKGIVVHKDYIWDIHEALGITVDMVDEIGEAGVVQLLRSYQRPAVLNRAVGFHPFLEKVEIVHELRNNDA